MNNYEYYTTGFCDGHYCPRDCDRCPTADEIISFLSKFEKEEDE